MKISQIFQFKNTRKDLVYFDTLYQQTVSQLSARARRQYCINLVGRLRDDLRHCSCPEQKKYINLYLTAANAELDRLAPER
jgi:hypothetical protein